MIETAERNGRRMDKERMMGPGIKILESGFSSQYVCRQPDPPLSHALVLSVSKTRQGKDLLSHEMSAFRSICLPVVDV